MRNHTLAARACLISLVLVAAGLLAFLLSRASAPHGKDLVLALFLAGLMLVTNWRMSYFTTERGISLSDGDNNPDWLIRVADVAMYEAKHSGRGRYKFYDPSRSPGDYRMLLS